MFLLFLSLFLFFFVPYCFILFRLVLFSSFSLFCFVFSSSVILFCFVFFFCLFPFLLSFCLVKFLFGFFSFLYFRFVFSSSVFFLFVFFCLFVKLSPFPFHFQLFRCVIFYLFLSAVFVSLRFVFICLLLCFFSFPLLLFCIVSFFLFLSVDFVLFKLGQGSSLHQHSLSLSREEENKQNIHWKQFFKCFLEVYSKEQDREIVQITQFHFREFLFDLNGWFYCEQDDRMLFTLHQMITF